MIRVLRATPAVAGALLLAAACTVHQTDAPGLAGPSTLAHTIDITATPDSITQDGVSRSTITVTAHGPSGAREAGVTVRLDMRVGGVVQDFGTLASRSITTDSNGTASTTYTAPPAPPPGSTSAPTCTPGVFSAAVPGQCVDIIATPVNSDFQTVTNQFVTVRLVPQGVILPPADTPTPQFSWTPTPVQVGVPVTFDASASCSGAIVNGACTGSGTISSFVWNFGDGGTGSGSSVSHSFSSAASFNVTLTVVNDRGVSASTTQTVNVNAPAAPTAKFTASPTNPAITGGTNTVLFDAATSTAAVGHTIVSYSWNFGDPSAGGTTNPNTASGVIASHTYPKAGAYTVVLTVTDDIGQQASASLTVTVSP